MPHVARAIHGSGQGMTEFLSQTLAITEVTRGVEPGRTPSTRLGRKVRMLLSFQRPSRPVGKGSPSKGRSPEPRLLERAENFSSFSATGVGPGQTGCPCPAERKYTHSSEPRVARSSRGRPGRVRSDAGSLVAQGYPRPTAPRNRQLVQVGGPRWCPTGRPQW